MVKLILLWFSLQVLVVEPPPVSGDPDVEEHYDPHGQAEADQGDEDDGVRVTFLPHCQPVTVRVLCTTQYYCQLSHIRDS